MLTEVVGSFALLVVEHILSVITLICILASFFFSSIFVGIFIFKPYDEEALNEKKPLLSESKSETKSQEEESKESWYSHAQIALLAVAYCGIQASWFNSNKVLMQLSWPSPTNSEEVEVK